jgi:hypothetical protein
MIIGALRELGIEGSLGEAPGEWCPGAWSVQGPGGKLAGLAQRQIGGGAWCEALIVIERPPALRLLSQRVHELLDIPWREHAQGELARVLPGEPDLHARLSDAIVRALRREWPALEERALPVVVHGLGSAAQRRPSLAVTGDRAQRRGRPRGAFSYS